MLFGFERLMQAFRIAPARHHAAGEFVDDDDFVVADDIVLVALEEFVRAHRLIDVMDDRHIDRIVERSVFVDQAGSGEQFFYVLIAVFRQIDGALLFIDVVIFREQMRNELVDRVVEIGLVVGGARDDKRRARLIDQNGIDFVDNAESMAALDHLAQLIFHIVAQIVEAELIVRAVSDVGGIGGAALGIFFAVHDGADGQPEKSIDAPHPFGVAAGEIIVDGDDMDALARERVEIGGERRDKRLAFAGSHLGDGAFMQHHAADELNIEMTLAQHAPRGFAHRRKGGDENIVERLALGERGAEFIGPGAQLRIGQPAHFGFEFIDGRDLRPIGLQPPVIGGSKDFLGDGDEHSENLSHPIAAGREMQGSDTGDWFSMKIVSSPWQSWSIPAYSPIAKSPVFGECHAAARHSLNQNKA